MTLIPVDPANDAHVHFLYDCFNARPMVARISSRGNYPTSSQHRKFVQNHPYADWCLIEAEIRRPGFWGAWVPCFVGSVSLSQPAKPSVAGDELGINILPEYQGHGYAEKALVLMMEKHGPRRYGANIAHMDYATMALFQKLGFGICQVSFVKEAGC